MPLLASFGASLNVFAGDFGWCPPTTAWGRFPIALNEDDPDHLFTRGMLGGDVKQLLHGPWLIATELMH
jgi:hypothetical protein